MFGQSAEKSYCMHGGEIDIPFIIALNVCSAHSVCKGIRYVEDNVLG